MEFSRIPRPRSGIWRTWTKRASTPSSPTRVIASVLDSEVGPVAGEATTGRQGVEATRPKSFIDFGRPAGTDRRGLHRRGCSSRSEIAALYPLLKEKSRSTYENAVYAKEMIRPAAGRTGFS